jgi:acyl transferase domain-containing protein
MAGIFPDAANIEDFWKNISTGKCSVEKNGSLPDLYPWAAILGNSKEFDAKFFGISEREALCMDPQQRLFLSCSYKALDHAGYANNLTDSKCGIYAGFAHSDFQETVRNSAFRNEPQIFWGSSESLISARIAYFLNLKGPALTINTACSSSLVAVHLACQALLSGEIEIALAGGVFLVSPSFSEMAYNAKMVSPRGRCAPFDSEADGFVPGNQ